MPLQRISVKNNDIENWIMTSSTEPVYNKQGNHGDGNSRFGSTSSNISFSNNDICRICHCEADSANPLLAPCYCSGSLKYVHQACLQQWLTASETRSCELCKFNFIMHTKIKPFNEWRRLEMSYVERRRLCCAVLFHCVAALCVIWSLFVLIDRAAEEVQKGTIAWPFWTKLVVVAVGFTGGAVFMYIQCRQYLQLCNRWRAHNRILLIQNAPEKAVAPSSPNFRISVRPSAANHTAISNAQVVANIENNPLQQNNLDTNTQQQETGFPVAVISNVSENNSLKSQQSIVSSNSNNRNNAPLNLSSSYIFGERNLTTAAQPSTSKNPIENTSVFKERNSSIRSDNSIQLKPMEISNSGDLKSSDMISQTCLPTNFRNALKNQRRTSQHDAFFRLETPNFDPLEINMQETLASDIESRLNRSRTGKNSVISLANVTTTDREINFEKNRSVFKSLPNLTASTERLLP